ncbi:MAG TPA: cardiolipin synthase [Polyangiaceae bacterium]|jgi:cardiolipin synthase
MFWTILSGCEVAYLVAMIVVIILEKRSPISTIAWILALAMLPYVGLVVYFFIGPHRVRRKRMRHGHSSAEVRGQLAAEAKLHPEVAAPHRVQLAKLASRASGSVMSTAKRIEILAGGKACFDAIVDAISRAERHVHVCYYIFEADRTGTRIRDALVERARAGVKVRLLTDAVGTSLSRKFLRPLREAGAECARFNPIALGGLLPRFQLRNHRKIVIVDGRVGFLGGINVGDEYDESVSKRDAFRDTHACIEGSAVRELQFTFLEDWHFSTSRVVRDKGLFPPPAAGEHEAAIIVPSGPDQEWEAIEHVYFTAITQADERIQLTTPYFVPDEPVRIALSAAALRGVRVEIVVPRRSDSLIVTAAARSYFDELLRAGAHVYEYPRMVHAKTMIVDGKIGIVGSANLDNRSFRLNFEVSMLFYAEKALADLGALFETDKQKSRHITLKARSRVGLPMRFAEASARLLSPLL